MTAFWDFKHVLLIIFLMTVALSMQYTIGQGRICISVKKMQIPDKECYPPPI